MNARAFILLVICSVSLLGCEKRSTSVDLVDVPAITDCPLPSIFPGVAKPISTITQSVGGYFPKGRFAGSYASRDDFINGWYSRHLKALGEPSLLSGYQGREAYRFLWLRSFHHPIAVRVERNPNSIDLTLTETSGRGGYDPGTPLQHTAKQMTVSQWCEFLSLLNKSNFWSLEDVKDDMGNDGAEWILEGVRDDHYSVVDRWSPRDGTYRDACILLLQAGGIDTKALANDLY